MCSRWLCWSRQGHLAGAGAVGWGMPIAYVCSLALFPLHTDSHFTGWVSQRGRLGLNSCLLSNLISAQWKKKEPQAMDDWTSGSIGQRHGETTEVLNYKTAGETRLQAVLDIRDTGATLLAATGPLLIWWWSAVQALLKFWGFMAEQSHLMINKWIFPLPLLLCAVACQQSHFPSGLSISL